MRFRYVFFDRDGTLTYYDREKEAWRDGMIARWGGTPFETDYATMMELFAIASEGRKPWYRNVEDEKGFFRRYYRAVLERAGVRENLDERAGTLFDTLWLKDRKTYPETEDVLRRFAGAGCRMGVISDTSPSLELSLRLLGLGDWFESFTASSLTGAGKPDPRIYRAAMDSLGAAPSECLYIDDCREEADGARAVGMTAFHLDREGREPGDSPWTVRTLSEFYSCAEKL